MTPSCSPEQVPCRSRYVRTHRSFPVFTMGLVAVGALIYAFSPEAGRSAGACLCAEGLSVMDLVLVTAAVVLVHPGLAHLSLHLGLLTYFGGYVERRLGVRRVLAAVVMGSILAALISLNLFLEQGAAGASAGLLIRHPPIGFSGAVAGLMGLFVVECVGARPPGLSSLTPSAVIGTFLMTLYMLQVWVAWEGIPFGSGGSLGGWAIGGAFLGGLGVGVVAAAADGDRDTPGIGPEKAKPQTAGPAVSDRPPVRMAFPTSERRVGTCMPL